MRLRAPVSRSRVTLGEHRPQTGEDAPLTYTQTQFLSNFLRQYGMWRALEGLSDGMHMVHQKEWVIAHMAMRQRTAVADSQRVLSG